MFTTWHTPGEGQGRGGENGVGNGLGRGEGGGFGVGRGFGFGDFITTEQHLACSELKFGTTASAL